MSSENIQTDESQTAFVNHHQESQHEDEILQQDQTDENAVVQPENSQEQIEIQTEVKPSSEEETVKTAQAAAPSQTINDVSIEQDNANADNEPSATVDKKGNIEVEVHEINADNELEEQSSAETISSLDQKPTTSKRIYIANVHYNTTEDEIANLFKNYEVVSIIIPHYTIRLFRYKQKPMGIAYVDFKTHDQAAKAIKEFHNYELNGRQLRIKFYYPYIPYSKRDSKKNSNYNLQKQASDLTTALDPTTSELINVVDNVTSESDSATSSISFKKKNKSKKRKYLKKYDNEPKISSSKTSEISNNNQSDEESCKPKKELKFENEDEKSVEVESNNEKKQENNNPNTVKTSESSNITNSNKIKIEKITEKVEYSKDTIYISKLQAKTTDIDLRKFFEEFEPSDIYIFKGKYYHRPFRFGQRHMCALITLAAEDGQSKALKKLQNEKLNGKFLKLYPAFNSKVEEIKRLVNEKHEELNEAQKSETMPVDSKTDKIPNDQKIPLKLKNSAVEQQYEDEDEEDEGEESHIIITEAQPVAV